MSDKKTAESTPEEKLEQLTALLTKERAERSAEVESFTAIVESIQVELAAKTAELESFTHNTGSIDLRPLKPQVAEQAPAKTFKVGKDEYRFTIPAFKWNGETVKSIDALNDKELLSDLVSIGAGVIERV
ncbi:MAG: hypothetical protein ABI002_11235 [Saprospiraceae bacterium]